MRLWLALGWRISAIQQIRQAWLENRDICIATPTMKNVPLELPVTRIKCRCELYQFIDKFDSCYACSIEIPRLPLRLPMAAFQKSAHSSHSFRRTLAVALLLAIRYFNIDERVAAPRVNERLKWFTRKNDELTGEYASNLHMLHYYGDHHDGTTWQTLDSSMQRIALEILLDSTDRLYEFEGRWYIARGRIEMSKL